MNCFVLPSRYEGLGVVAIEAQACSVPVICSTAVPKDAKITSSVKFIGLDESSSNWADCVLDVIKTQVKRNEREEVRKAGYDIEVEAQKLTVTFMRNC